MKELRKHFVISILFFTSMLFLKTDTVYAGGEIPYFLNNLKNMSIAVQELDSAAVNKFDAPKWVMFRSLAFPGWGQWHNEKKIKSAAIFCVETFFIASYFVNKNKLKDLEDEYFSRLTELNEDEILQYENDITYYEDKRNKYAWYFVFAALYGMIDAFVDSYLKDFNSDMDINIVKTNSDTAVLFNLNFNLGKIIHRSK